MSRTLVERAKSTALAAHSGQTRWNGDAYISHPARVAESVKHLGKNYEAAAWLHDVVEDTALDHDEIYEMFNPRVSSAITYLTKRRGEPYWASIERLSRGGDIAIRVKMADISDNLSDLEYTTHKSMYNKYRLALMYLEKVNAITGFRH